MDEADSENKDVPTINRDSDMAEARADEKQDVTTSLNFPLHWTSAKLSWDYLFDFSVACDLLAPRPDDLVLDFAAGTCWATELLGRLGVRTVSVDLSVEMMRRGRTRLATDSRLIFRDEAGFVAARGQSLPFATEAFDGVLCMNALHHLPSYAEALREIYRVLKPGGRAVFSEPGSAHAGQPLSQFRMREESIIEKNVSLPMVRRLAMEAGFSRMRVVPLRSSAGYVFEYAATSDDVSRLRQMWDDTLRHYPSEHARFVLHKGDERPADTLLPAHELSGRLDARIVSSGCVTLRPQIPFTDRLQSGTPVRGGKPADSAGGLNTLGLRSDAAGEVPGRPGRTCCARCRSRRGNSIEMTVAGQLPPGQCGLHDMRLKASRVRIPGLPMRRRTLDHGNLNASNT